MYYHASKHQLNHIAELIGSDFEIYGPKSDDHIYKYDKIDNIAHISWRSQKTILPFKKILFPRNKNIETRKNKIALLALPLCDIAALNLFLKQFSGSGLIPLRDDIFIVGSNCTPDENCFCDQFDLDKLHDFDMFIIKKDEEYNIIVNGWKAKEIVEKAGLKKNNTKLVFKPKIKSDKIDLKQTKELINDKKLTHDFWQSIANNCFGCGACSTVCPLCFCFDQDFENQIDGSCKRCINWTSCFSTDFSQIQFGHDLRPTNTDRLYNWYHHKFTRAPHELSHPTCVGCGRCITACPAHLNIKSIIKSLNKKYGSKNKK